jgi:anti-anti-sigma factor
MQAQRPQTHTGESSLSEGRRGVVDLSDTRYLDSAGIDMLLRLSERLEHRRAELILVIPGGSQLRRLATIVGLSRTITIHSSRADALREKAVIRRF